MPHDISSATADAVREYAQVLSFAWHRVENDRSRGTTPARSATARISDECASALSCAQVLQGPPVRHACDKSAPFAAKFAKK